MKLLRLALIAVSLMLTHSTFADPDSFAVICRGGAGYSVDFSSSRGKIDVFYWAEKNPRRATDGLDVGTCAWLDRPISYTETSLIHIELNRIFGSRLSVRMNVNQDYRVEDARIYNSADVGDTQYSQLLQAMQDPTQTFYLKGYSNPHFAEITVTGNGSMY